MSRKGGKVKGYSKQGKNKMIGSEKFFVKLRVFFVELRVIEK
jgi:hypothetical protein